MKKNNIGICGWLLPITEPASITLAGQLGFDGLQIQDLGGAEQNYLMNNPRIQDMYRSLAEEAGVEIQLFQLQSLVRSGKVKCAPGTEGNKEAVYAVREGVEACTAIGIKRLMVHSFFDSVIQNDYDLENTAAFLRQAGDITADSGIQLVYESFSCVQKTMALYELSGKAFRLCYDTLNPLRYGFGDPREELLQYPLEMIDHIHVKDARNDFSCSARLGTGRGHFAEVAAILRQKGYSGWLVSENYYCVGAFGRECDPFEHIAADLETLRKEFPKL